MATTNKKLEAAQKKFGLVRVPTETDYKEFAQTGTFPKYLYGASKAPATKKTSTKDLSTEDLAAIQKKHNLTKAPTGADVQEFLDTGSFSRNLTGQKSVLTPAKSTADTVKDVNQTDTPQQARDQYLQNYIQSLNEEFDVGTKQNLTQYDRSQSDADLQMQYYRQDFDKITSRKNQDYITGIALQDKKFSQSLDYISNYVWRSIGALAGIGKSRITDATQDKMEEEKRIKLNYDQNMQDMQSDKERQEARYKLGTLRLAEDRGQYETQRSKEKNVMGIKATGEITQYYDTLMTDTILSEDAAAKQRKNITGGGTRVETIFDN
jgi:hypothetical protein